MQFVFINDSQVAKIEEHESYDVIPDAHLFQVVHEISFFEREPVVGWAYANDICYPILAPISPRQIRTALLLMGIDLTMIDAALDSLPEPTKSFAKVSWNYSMSYERTDPLVSSVAALLGWDADQTDQLWITGAAL